MMFIPQKNPWLFSAGLAVMTGLSGCASSPRVDVQRLAQAPIDSSTDLVWLSDEKVDELLSHPADIYVEPFTAKDLEAVGYSSDDAEAVVHSDEESDSDTDTSAWAKCNARQGCDKFLGDLVNSRDLFDLSDHPRSVSDLAKGGTIRGTALPSDRRAFEALFVDCSLANTEKDNVAACINLVLEFMKIGNRKAAEAVWRDTQELRRMDTDISNTDIFSGSNIQNARDLTFAIFEPTEIRAIYPQGPEEIYLHAFLELQCVSQTQSGYCRFKGVL